MLWTYLSSLKTKEESGGLRHPKLPCKRKEENILFLASNKTLYFHFKAVKWAEKKWKKRQHHKYKITPSSENIEDWRKCEWKAIGLAMQPRCSASPSNMLYFPFLCSYCLNVSYCYSPCFTICFSISLLSLHFRSLTRFSQSLWFFHDKWH